MLKILIPSTSANTSNQIFNINQITNINNGDSNQGIINKLNNLITFINKLR